MLKMHAFITHLFYSLILHPVEQIFVTTQQHLLQSRAPQTLDKYQLSLVM